MKTIAQQLGITNFPFTINDSKGNKIYWEKSDGTWKTWEYDRRGNKIYEEHSNGYWEKSEYDSEGTHIYYEDSDGAIIDNRNVPEEKSKEESPDEALLRLIKDKVVLEATRQFGCSLTRDVMYIVLNGNTMTDEYYSKLMDVTNVINKLHGTHFTVTIEYPHFSI